MSKKISFKKAKEIVLSKNCWKKDRKIVDTWYEIEDTDPEISTERLAMMTADRHGWSYEDVIETMSAFAEQFNKVRKGGCYGI